MKTNFIDVGYATPTANVSINKNRVKIYKNAQGEEIIYLEHGSEFMLELFNPTLNTILAKISLNGNQISQSGLILRPGERVFLERYLDIPKKFKFETYEVGNTEQAKKAIENNGDVKIEFFNEKTYFNICFNNTGTFTPVIPTWGICSSGTANYGSSRCTTSVSCSTNPIIPTQSSRTIETGRVEQGGSSNQNFSYANKDFDCFPFHIVNYKILPSSQKAFISKEIKKYCTGCGSKLKPKFKFCPGCGEKA